MAKFSKHAFERTQNRLSLTHKQVSNILDSDKAVNIGVEESSRRVHRLFYSKPDGVPFVAVQDEKCGTVVTILPIDYHNRCAWHVSYDAQKDAEEIITGVPRKQPPSTISLNASGNQPSYYRLKAVLYDAVGKIIQRYNLGSMPRFKETDTAETLLKSDGFPQELEARVKEKCRSDINLERLEIEIRAGKYGESFYTFYEDALVFRGYDEILKELKRR